MKPTESEIEQQQELASCSESKFFGMTYEEGVVAALDWVLGYTDTKPMDD